MIKLNSAAIGTASHQVHRILASHFLATSSHGRTASWNRSFSSTSTAPFSMDDCPHRSFAKNHPDIARNILIVPPYSVLDYSFAGLSDLTHHHVSLEKYLHWRGWNIDKILSGFETTDSNVAQSAIGLLSHPLTFPLTLAYHSNVFVNNKQFSIHQAVPQSDDMGDKKVMRLCCVGARAECTLPDGYWREFLVMSSAMIRAHSSDTETKNDANAMKPGESLEWILDFVGPEIPRQIMTKTINIFDDIEDCRGQQTRQQQQQQPKLVMNYHASFLHEVIQQFLKLAPQAGNRTEKIRQFWDGFVLFNPGLGHPNLEKQWKPTMEFLFSTGKPILFTAHSELDAERDASVLEELLAHWNHRDLSYSKECSYGDNPFSSRMEFVDPFPPVTIKNRGGIHVVRPNHSVLILQ